VNDVAGGDRNSHYVLVFLVLVTLTAMEVSLIGMDLTRAVRITALAGLAMAKGGALLLFFMHLRSESPALKLVAALPLVVAPAFAIVLMLDAVYRVAGGH
jgi:caa(3)-type oxidase subunit IV